MDFKLNRETIPAAETVFSGIQEQSVELDYILPDYYPDIFRLIRCEITPVITEYSVNGDKLTYELRCDIRILYCGEDGSVLQSVSQQQIYTRSADLGRSPGKAEINIIPKTGHINFRAVNKRRLDIRAAVSVRINVVGTKEQEVISDAFGMNIQLRRVPVTYAAQSINTGKTIQLTEEAELGSTQPDIANIITVQCSPGECEVKMISGKLLAKGDVNVSFLYSPEGNTGTVEQMSFPLSFSQIIDAEGIDDTFSCTVKAEVLSCEITPGEGKGDERKLRCETELRLDCRAVKTASVMLAEDAFSTVYPCEVMTSEIQAEQIPVVYTDSFRNSVKLSSGENAPKEVFAMWCSPKNINTRLSEDGRSVIISGMLTYSMAAKDASGMITMPDKDETFEETIAVGEDLTGSSVTAEISVNEVSYNMSSDGELTAKSDISVKISSSGSSVIKVLTDIVIDDSGKKQRDGDYAVKLYYGVENEDIWDIAKRCSTSVRAIMEENELTSDKLSGGGMILIPIKE